MMMSSCHCLKIVEKNVEVRREGNVSPKPSTQSPPPKIIPAEKLGRTIVELYKPDNSNLGLTVSETSDVPCVATIRPGSIADRSDCLLLNDRVLRINGISTLTLQHEEIVRLVKTSGPRIIMEIEYELPEIPRSLRHTTSKRTQVTLERDGESFGFTVRGGYNKDPQKIRPLTVMHVRPGSSAERDGRVKAGDRILSINGTIAENLTCEEAVRLMKMSEYELLIFVEYNVAVVDNTRQAGLPVMVEIDKLPSERLGISLAPCLDERDIKIFYIDNIREGSIADRCGALQLGDNVYSIDDLKVDHMTLQEAMHRLKSNVFDRIRLEIVPRDGYDSQLLNDNHHIDRNLNSISRPKSLPGRVNSLNYFSSPPSGIEEQTGTSLRPASNQQDRQSTPSSTSPRTMSRCSCHANVSTGGGGMHMAGSDGNHGAMIEQNSDNSILSPGMSIRGNKETSSSGLIVPSLENSRTPTPQSYPHQEGKVTNQTQSNTHHFGEGYQRSQSSPPLPSRLLQSNLLRQSSTDSRKVKRHQSLDRKVKRQSSLDRSPALNEDDDLSGLMMTGIPPLQSTSSRSTPTSSLKLRSSLSLSSGSLHVSNQNPTVCRIEEIEVTLGVDEMGSFGFTLIAPNHGPSDPLSEYPVIEYVQPGGTAYQSSVIQENDRVISVDGESTTRRSLDDINSQILSSGASLTLCLQFDVADGVVPTSGVFNVKLVKRFESIGINLQAPAHRKKGDPFLISKVTPGSVAHRSGSILPGDLLLAVNGVSVEYLNLPEAVALLHDAENLVTLKIQKEEEPSSVSDEFESQLIFRVELTRRSPNQPWGIVVSGLDDTSVGPIFIDSLTNRGPADLNGRLQPGDQILAINGQGLQGKTLSQAMSMLQQMPDKVVLKLARFIQHKQSDVSSQRDILCVSSTRQDQSDIPSSQNNTCLPLSIPSKSSNPNIPVSNQNSRKYQAKALMNQQVFNKSFDSAFKVQTTPRFSETSTSNSGESSDIQEEPEEDLDQIETSHCNVQASSGAQSKSTPSLIPGRDISDISNRALIQTQSVSSKQNPQSSGTSTSKPVRYNTVPLDQIQCPGCREAIENEFKNMRTPAIHTKEHSNQYLLNNRSGDSRPKRQTSADSRIIRSRTPTSTGMLDKSSEQAKSKSSLSSHNNAWVHRGDSIETGDLIISGGRDKNVAMAMVRRFWVRLVKSSENESFGIGVSHSQSPRGVVITAIRPNSPAATSGQIALYDRILKVNDLSTEGMNCAEVVNLISRSGRVLDLFIQRRKTSHSAHSQNSQTFTTSTSSGGGQVISGNSASINLNSNRQQSSGGQIHSRRVNNTGHSQTNLESNPPGTFDVDGNIVPRQAVDLNTAEKRSRNIGPANIRSISSTPQHAS